MCITYQQINLSMISFPVNPSKNNKVNISLLFILQIVSSWGCLFFYKIVNNLQKIIYLTYKKLINRKNVLLQTC